MIWQPAHKIPEYLITGCGTSETEPSASLSPQPPSALILLPEHIPHSDPEGTVIILVIAISLLFTILPPLN